MTTIYQRLSPLGFAEWLEKKFPSMTYVIEWLQEQDKEPIDSYQRTSTNALAFRWIREEHDLESVIEKYYPRNKPPHFEYSLYQNEKTVSEIFFPTKFQTHPEAEIACLEKAAEIIEQKK